MNNERWAELGRRVRAQREAMGLTRRDVRDRGGPSETFLQKLENGRIPDAKGAVMGPRLRRALEGILGFERRSMDVFLDGGELTLVTEPATILGVGQVIAKGPAFVLNGARPVNEMHLLGMLVTATRAANAAEGIPAPEGPVKALIADVWRFYHAAMQVAADALGVSPQEARTAAARRLGAALEGSNAS